MAEPSRLLEPEDRGGGEVLPIAEAEVLREQVVGVQQPGAAHDDADADGRGVGEGEVVAVDVVGERAAAVSHQGGHHDPAHTLHRAGVDQVEVLVVDDVPVAVVEHAAPDGQPIGAAGLDLLERLEDGRKVVGVHPFEGVRTDQLDAPSITRSGPPPQPLDGRVVVEHEDGVREGIDDRRQNRLALPVHEQNLRP